nr:hypothetical protein [uncultured Pseudomonas sp.]
MIKEILSWVAGAFLTITICVVGYQQSQISKLDERIYTMQSTVVTEQKLNTAITQLSKDIDDKISSLRNEQAVTNKVIERAIDKLDELMIRQGATQPVRPPL